MGCNCLGVFSKYIHNDNTLIPGQKCDRNQTKYGCVDVKPINPIKMGQFNGTRICGASTGTPFVNVTRPIKETGSCPTGTKACSTFTSVNNTICYPLGIGPQDCPITDIQVVTTNQLISFNTNSNSLNVSLPFYYKTYL